jgi:hypothetical protein
MPRPGPRPRPSARAASSRSMLGRLRRRARRAWSRRSICRRRIGQPPCRSAVWWSRPGCGAGLHVGRGRLGCATAHWFTVAATGASCLARVGLCRCGLGRGGLAVALLRSPRPRSGGEEEQGRQERAAVRRRQGGQAEQAEDRAEQEQAGGRQAAGQSRAEEAAGLRSAASRPRPHAPGVDRFQLPAGALPAAAFHRPSARVVPGRRPRPTVRPLADADDTSKTPASRVGSADQTDRPELRRSVMADPRSKHRPGGS